MHLFIFNKKTKTMGIINLSDLAREFNIEPKNVFKGHIPKKLQPVLSHLEIELERIIKEHKKRMGIDENK